MSKPVSVPVSSHQSRTVPTNRTQRDQQESSYIRVINPDKIEIKRGVDGKYEVSPILAISVGTEPGEDGDFDDGVDYIDDIYDALRDTIKVPCIIHSTIITPYILS